MVQRHVHMALKLPPTLMLTLAVCPLWAAGTTAAPPPAAPSAPSSAVSAAPAPASIAVPAERLPVEAFAQLPFVEHAVISPDGIHWAGLLGLGGVQTIAIFNIHEKPALAVRVKVPDQANVRWLHWANADNVLVGLDALESVRGDDWYLSRLVGVSRVTGKVAYLLWDLGGQNASDVVWVPNDGGNEVLVAAPSSSYRCRWPTTILPGRKIASRC